MVTLLGSWGLPSLVPPPPWALRPPPSPWRTLPAPLSVLLPGGSPAPPPRTPGRPAVPPSTRPLARTPGCLPGSDPR
eukprot:11891074-Heterocapsa_arctica.AAC.1